MHRPLFSIRLAALASLLAPLASACTPATLEERPSVGTFAYRLGAGDRLRIVTYGEEKLSGEFAVNAEGNVAFPLLGAVPAAGLTLAQFHAAVEEGLGASYMRHPRVSVEMLNLRPVYILGEVQRPGEFAFVDRMSIHALVAKAGGFTYRANPGHVYIRGEHDAEERAVRLTSGTAVQPGDTIRIPQRTF